MKGSIDVQETSRQAHRAIDQDGLFEFYLGLILLILALFLIGSVALENFVFFIWPIFLIIFLPLSRKLFTYPRVGYVKFSSTNWRPSLPLFLVVSLFFLSLGVYVALTFDPRTRTPVLDIVFENLSILVGLIISAVLINQGRQSGIARFYVLALISVVGGLLGATVSRAYFKYPIGDSMLGYSLIVGTIFLIMGAYTFVRFLTKNPLPAQRTHD